MKVVVSGEIGSGKSTAVRAAMKKLGWEHPAGFFTHWAGKERGAKVLHLETWNGESVPMAHRIRESEPQMDTNECEWGSGWSRDALVPEVGPTGALRLQRREQPPESTSPTQGILPYRLDEAVFTRRAIASLLPAVEGCPVVIDELGLIELGAAEFVHVLAEVFSKPVPVLAVVQRRALEQWQSLLGTERIDKTLFVEPATRDTLPGQIAALFWG